ncbi:hypothetical protein B0H34DRAFT_655742 [Crassisporium funariophilum]|nr:hypothetical protein B0H34DRAFT_655742 [Crassisporium funariophilum]
MYRGTPSPIFDVPEFPALRRVKPLPKRRRTMAGHDTTLTLALLHQQPLDILGPNATAEELLAHADTLSARMALQSYYMPILGGVQSFLAGAAANGGAGRNGQLPADLADLDSIEFGVHFAAAAAAAAAAGVAMGGLGGVYGRDDDDGRGDGDYVDHLRQPGNTKKRKVPANAGGSPRGGLGGDGGRPDRDRDRDRDRDHESSTTPPPVYPPPAFPGQLSLLAQKRGKLTAATLAGLQHKELLKIRKRQLAAVMGALSHGDTLALDQALSASYPLIGGLGSGNVSSALAGNTGGGRQDAQHVRKSKRMPTRLARAMKLTRVPRHPDAAPFPSSEFGYVCSSATADRLIATKEEVEMLRSRFEVELERQAAKAAKIAVAASGAMMKASGGRGKREKAERDRERAQQKVERQQRARMITAGGNSGGDQTAEFLDPAGVVANVPAGAGTGAGGGKVKNGKKKKRSALANASNPHHLRNYVPSRLPHTGGGGGTDGNGGVQGQAATNANTIGPLPLRFLSAEIPPRRRKKSSTPAVPSIQLTHPTEEWICAFCEYDLFYGEDPAYRRAVRSRKKILKRRRRARERAAAAASGTSTAKGAPPQQPPPEEYEGYEPTGVVLDEFGNATPKTKWKGDPNKEQQAFG